MLKFEEIFEMKKNLAFGEKNYNYYGAYLKQKFNGQKVYKVIVDAGFTCPNRDGSKGFGGCSYCNVESFTPVPKDLENFREQLNHGMKNAIESYKAEKFIIYFQPNSNTYASVDELKMLYDEALKINSENIVGLSVGTRPDCIDSEKIKHLESYCERGLEVDLELGIESIHNSTLAEINRGCTHQDFEKAMELLKNTPLNICVHCILGLPNESREMILQYAEEINKYPQIKFVKFHNLHIVKGSIMGVKYKREPFKLFTLEEYIDLLCELLPLLRPDIVIQRLFAVSDTEMLIAPKWGLKKNQIQSLIEKELEKRGVVQGALFQQV